MPYRKNIFEPRFIRYITFNKNEPSSNPTHTPLHGSDPHQKTLNELQINLKNIEDKLDCLTQKIDRIFGKHIYLNGKIINLQGDLE